MSDFDLQKYLNNGIEKITADIARVVQDFTIVVSMADGATLLTNVIG